MDLSEIPTFRAKNTLTNFCVPIVGLHFERFLLLLSSHKQMISTNNLLFWKKNVTSNCMQNFVKHYFEHTFFDFSQPQTIGITILINANTSLGSEIRFRTWKSAFIRDKTSKFSKLIDFSTRTMAIFEMF
jgi:hypothetical protein